MEREKDVLLPIMFYLEQVRENRNEPIRRLFEVEKNLKRLSKKNIDRFLEWSYRIKKIQAKLRIIEHKIVSKGIQKDDGYPLEVSHLF